MQFSISKKKALYPFAPSRAQSPPCQKRMPKRSVEGSYSALTRTSSTPASTPWMERLNCFPLLLRIQGEKCHLPSYSPGIRATSQGIR